MSAETDFLNYSLGKTGNSRITNIDDGSPNAKWCKTFYIPLRQALIRMHRWDWSIKRKILAADTIGPIFGFSTQFTLPTELLRIDEFNGQNMSLNPSDPMFWGNPADFYKIEGQKLLTNATQAYLVYGQDIDNPALWDVIFYQGLASWLASELALAINKKPSLAAELLTQANGLFIPLGMSVDGQQGTQSPFIVDDLTWGR